MKELRLALLGVQKEAADYKSKPDPNAARAAELRRRAETADEAANAVANADRLERELNVLTEDLNRRADVRLGALLFKRRIKPGAVVTKWAKSKGAHAGELSKAEFREEVQLLGLKATGPYPTTGADIDAVFDSFDEDGGGYMDAEEAKAMVKGLQVRAVSL